MYYFALSPRGNALAIWSKRNGEYLAIVLQENGDDL